MIRGFQWCALVVACVFFSASAWAEVSWALGSNSLLIERAKKMQQEETGRQDNGGDGIVQLLYRTHFQIESGRIVQSVESVYFYRTLNAIQDHGSDSVTWDSGGEALQFTEAAVITTLGSLNQFDPSTVQIVDTDSSDVFTDDREIIVQWPGISAGAISVLSYKRTLTDEVPFHVNTYLHAGFARRNLEISAVWETERPRWHIGSDLISCQEEERSLHCSATNIEPPKLDPDVFFADVLPQFSIAAHFTWDDLINDMNARVDLAVNNSELLAEQFAQLSEDGEMLARLHEFVSREVRYVSFSEGDYSYQPHSIDLTLRNKYGDCKDKSVLLLALLKAGNINAYPVLVSTARQRPELLQLPGYGYFDHMVVCMRRADSSEHCFDPTDPSTDAETIPSGIQGKVRLNLLSGSKPTTVPQSEFRWRVDVENKLQFQVDGSQIEELNRAYYGEYASWLRSRLNSRNAEEQEAWFFEDYHSTITDEVEVSFSVKGKEAKIAPLTISSDAAFPPLVDTDEDLNYTDSTYWLRSFVQDQNSENENYDFRQSGFQLRSTYEFDLNGLWKPVALGPEVHFQSRFGELQRSYSSDEDVVTVNTLIQVPAQTIAVADIKDFNRFLELLALESRIRIRGKKVP